MGAIEESMQILKDARAKSDAVLVSFSGGKDSLVVLDLCVRTFRRVEAFFMAFVPGLACVEEPAIAGAARFGVPLHMVPHWAGLRCLKNGVYCFNPPERDHWVDAKLRDIYTMVIEDTGIPLIAMGGKRKDGLWRKRNLDSTKGWQEVITPIVGWSNHEVAAHLAGRGIPTPKGDSVDGSGVDLSKPAVLWLWRNHREDFEILESYFPFVRAIVIQEELYGKAKAR